MRKLLVKKVWTLVSSLLVASALASASVAQDTPPEAPATPSDTTAVEPEGAASGEPVPATEVRTTFAPIPPDSFLSAPNDSAEIATAVAEMIRKEEAKPLNRLKNSRVGKMFIRGGLAMYPLLLCAIVALAVSIERLWTLTRARTNTKKLMQAVNKALYEQGPEAAMNVCARTRGPVAAILRAGLAQVDRGIGAVEKAMHKFGAAETVALERGLLVLATVSNVAPLLGFFGMVAGMITTFAALTVAGQVSARLVAQGIEEALITAAAGLIIAVPASILYGYFVHRVDRFVQDMEEASAELVDDLLDIEHRRARGQA